jgi:hypothetical protein
LKLDDFERVGRSGSACRQERIRTEAIGATSASSWSLEIFAADDAVLVAACGGRQCGRDHV